MKNLTRRSAVSAVVASFAAFAVAPTSALAITEGQAKSLVDKLVGEINKVIASGKSEASMLGSFERIFARYSDVPYMAAYTLGNDGRRASASQKKAYSKAFQVYIARKYGSRFREFIGGRLEVQGVKKVKKWYEVKATAYLKGQAPFEVKFLVSDRSGGSKFFNLYVEGINMLLTERTEIGSMLDKRRGNFDELIADLKKAS